MELNLVSIVISKSNMLFLGAQANSLTNIDWHKNMKFFYIKVYSYGFVIRRIG